MRILLTSFLLIFCFNSTSFSSEVNATEAGLQPYKTLYLLKNSNKNYFAVSAKIPLLVNSKSEPELNYNIYFAYSQKSIWVPSDTSGNDENYLYTNFNPEVFYIYDFHNVYSIPLLLQAGFEHESDGLGKIFDSQHREWDRIYLTTHYSFYQDQFKVAFKIWYSSLDKKYNPDIDRTMGFSELKLTTTYLKQFLQPKVELTVRKGTSHQMKDFTFIFEHHLDLFNILKQKYQTPFDFYTQAFYGYGEYLRSYKRIKKSLYFGISYNI